MIVEVAGRIRCMRPLFTALHVAAAAIALHDHVGIRLESTCITHHTSHITHHTSHITHHTSHMRTTLLYLSNLHMGPSAHCAVSHRLLEPCLHPSRVEGSSDSSKTMKWLMCGGKHLRHMRLPSFLFSMTRLYQRNTIIVVVINSINIVIATPAINTATSASLSPA